ncbi:acetyl-CoA decarbonylase/synthase complex subunit gamma [Dehalogenimonas formicexedens]|uniref:Acetyl-CoA decarbonylase/synthase complex subunit gamma n=1 Tax=Dehalogenimonas formicexedens TaxID=1839801 RepID=A0A1P8F6Z0_9CHLR|nr:acetyl-CoA decarbonylase/synthase complex subunit gamma [Dehalogenimonas formicexedens]APV44229.1 acetyl-CoA decarbonylase/synthase complex subunit gamma [Dehalogenimonas formicexedens]APV44256.1 acetyl-CoA decarbonylase/synthase complex subunit gamma [Dehalogenimonas formicexedens]
MALSGIEIFKYLPRTNCGKCGVPTCLAFAMSLAAGKAELSACPFVTAESKAKLEEASAPPIRPITISTGNKTLKVGGETVLFRHEKRFENPPGLAITISDTMPEAEIDRRLKALKFYTYNRVGATLRPELVALKYESGNPETYASLASRAKAETDAGIILLCKAVDGIVAAANACSERKPVLCAITESNLDLLAPIAVDYKLPVVARSESLDGLAELTDRLVKLGIKDIILDSGARNIKSALADQVALRRLALLKKFRLLGYPTIAFPGEMTDNPLKEALIASIMVAKYAGIIVLSDFRGETLFPLLVARMNLFSDPQRPQATAEGIYEINGPDENSPVAITCNFSLTYFIVSGEIENTRMPAHLLIKDTEGLSVMTAWAAGKFGADNIGGFVKKSGIADRIKHRKIIIPGYIAQESGGLEEQLPGWEIMVGPREAAHLLSYLKSNWK